eukprot:3633740-Rhodomonas_salina.1
MVLAAPSTELAYARYCGERMVLRACYALSGTELAYGAEQARGGGERGEEGEGRKWGEGEEGDGVAAG